jgi:hypothetical protein
MRKVMKGNTMKKAFVMLSLLAALAVELFGMSVVAHGQAPVTVKPSPASDALVTAAKEMTDSQNAFDTALQQARNGLEMTQKSLANQLQAAQKDLSDKLKSDKKYAPALANIETIQKQLNDLQNKTQQNFTQSSAPIQNKIAINKTLIDGLIPIVRKENNLPDTATFDASSQKWTTPKTADKPAEPKK